MDAQTLNDLTYERTGELTENPEVTLREEATGRFFRIVGHELDERDDASGGPFVLLIEADE